MKSNVFYQAMIARDFRFDGKFFAGVKTTGIYCRPICPAKPKRENVEFFPTAASAEKSGYRPCLRCRPESAPLSPAWFGKSAIVQRALRAIALNGCLDMNEDQFAERFGVSARYLRRLFIEEVGLTPKQIAFNNRLGFARKLITESQLPVTDVALTAGFSSLRRFNDAFKKRFRQAPRAMRERKTKGETSGVELTLSYRPPFDFESLLAFYRYHQIAGVEKISDSAFERVFKIGSHVGYFRVTNDSLKPQLRLKIVIDDMGSLFAVTQRVRQMFDLDSDPILIANSFRSDSFLNSLWRKYPGMRLARGWDAFETAICTVLGQLVSTTQARSLIQQLVENYGERIVHPLSGEDAYLFPTPHTLLKADMLAVRTTNGRRAAIREIARMTISKELDPFTPLLKDRLLSIAGIGPWSAEYINLRAYGDTDSFPRTDLILKRAIDRHPRLDLEKIRPWRGYAAIYLWKHYAQLLSKQKGRK